MNDQTYDAAEAIRRRSMMFDVSDDAPPCNLDGEATVLGALMIDNRLIDDLRNTLTDSDFYHPCHQKIYRLILSQHDEGLRPTPVTLRPIVERDPLMKATFSTEGGPANYLAQLTGNPAALIGARSISQQLVQLARAREIEESAARAVQMLLAGESTMTEATSALDEAIGKAIYQEKPVRRLTADKMVGKVKQRSARITEQKLASVGPTCATVTDLNTLLGPLDGGTYVLLAGRPGMGKTTLASSAAWGYAANGHPVLYLAAEGTEDTLAMRFTSDLSLDNGHPISHDAIKRDKLTQDDLAQLDLLEQRAALLPIDYQVIDRVDVRRVRSYVSRAAAKWKAKGRKLEVVFIDYLQLLDATHKGRDIDDDRRRVNYVSRELLRIAKDFDVTLFALSQLNRDVEKRPDKRPNVADLRESGRLEEDADAILLVYREEFYLEQEKPQEGIKDYQALLDDWYVRIGRCRERVDIILGKNRHGERRTRTAKFFGSHYAIRGGDYDGLTGRENAPNLFEESHR